MKDKRLGKVLFEGVPSCPNCQHYMEKYDDKVNDVFISYWKCINCKAKYESLM